MLCPARSPHLPAPLGCLRCFTPPLHPLARAASPAHLRPPRFSYARTTPGQRDRPACAAHTVRKLVERAAAFSILPPTPSARFLAPAPAHRLVDHAGVPPGSGSRASSPCPNALRAFVSAAALQPEPPVSYTSRRLRTPACSRPTDAALLDEGSRLPQAAHFPHAPSLALPATVITLARWHATHTRLGALPALAARAAVRAGGGGQQAQRGRYPDERRGQRLGCAARRACRIGRREARGRARARAVRQARDCAAHVTKCVYAPSNRAYKLTETPLDPDMIQGVPVRSPFMHRSRVWRSPVTLDSSAQLATGALPLLLFSAGLSYSQVGLFALQIPVAAEAALVSGRRCQVLEETRATQKLDLARSGGPGLPDAVSEHACGCMHE
jgi:hypothetical protein